MKKVEIIFSGVGGQGLVSGGTLLGEAASLGGYNAVLTTSYGVETRGTFTKSDLIISNSEIFYPEVLTPTVILALAPVAYARYASVAQKGCILIYDEDVIAAEDSSADQLPFPISSTAQALGNSISANILSLGLILGAVSILEETYVVEVIKKRFSAKPSVMEANLKLFKEGIQMAKGTLR